MAVNREIPEKLLYFLKNALKDVDDGYEYASELKRILNSDECQRALTEREIEFLRDYADKVKSVGEIDHYTEEKIKDIEREHFGERGIKGFLGIEPCSKPQWPF
ncbi:hypothetical protein CDQ84_18395 [Clostridium thermosuccinogenes]|mgnify:CR=1 FL=1|jgi:predicted house-cleaning noncanonical NTP pyrophosphatase (MazG superfamily)|uniref:Uncharacterized protein n=1 Tax=Clostridium thermosuccinogenes TaxID=84032 RepID=A0A2K2F1Q8_9CLOT|nr:hypothetical protein CDO33_09290 [Pseudoclostridium thermosuccinogenes]PNT91915.1 hypothetical protein CDQ85_18355 [Pseudoclostridium thermosuccinogenes]PNT92725.1 hypothetical protein CDQ83_03960 [Pseudoclostridium thermosuccinogenes]PNT94742.1 hypothetical protein CDQ84_18395 [Pseudoclostridium thermosuccinogenes]